MRILYTTFLLLLTLTPPLFCSPFTDGEFTQQGIIMPHGSILDHDNTRTYLSNESMLRIEGYDISGIIPALAERHPNITNLCLISCGKLSTDDLTNIGLFSKLRHLKLMDCGVTNVTSLHLTTRPIANNLFTLDISYHEIDDDGILGILTLSTLTSLKRLCIWNDEANDKLSEISINALCKSTLSNQLETFCIPCFKADPTKFTKTTKQVWKKRNSEYYLFYDTSATDNDVYMLDTPLVFGLNWEKVKNQWFLSREFPQSSSPSSEMKSPPHQSYQFYLECSDDDGSQIAFEEPQEDEVELFSSDTEI